MMSAGRILYVDLHKGFVMPFHVEADVFPHTIVRRIYRRIAGLIPLK